jgi:hypothetical protein
MLQDFGQVAAVDQVAAGWALLEMIGLAGRRPGAHFYASETPQDIGLQRT